MQSAILLTLQQVVIGQAGQDSWDAVLVNSGLSDEELQVGLGPEEVRRMVQAVCDTLNVHWIATFGSPIAEHTAPRFAYEWTDESTMVVKYLSHKPMVDLLIALLETIGTRIRDVVEVRRVGPKQVQLAFAA